MNLIVRHRPPNLKLHSSDDCVANWKDADWSQSTMEAFISRLLNTM